MTATEPIREQKNLQNLANYFLENKKHRDYALFVLAIHTTLRISDLLHLQWNDVYDPLQHHFYPHLTVIEKKTKKAKTIALNPCVIDALRLYYPYHRGNYIFASKKKPNGPISRQQAWRIMTTAYKELNIHAKIACHGLRKTWGYHAWTKEAISPVVIMDIYNHTDYNVTKRYLGIAQDDLDQAYLSMKFLE